jgi:hypothetical protein
MKTKYSKRRNKSKNKNKSIFLRRTKYVRKNKKTKTRTRKLLRGGVVMPFSETSGIFGNISNTVNGWVNTLVLHPTDGYNPLLPIDSRVSSQFLNNDPTQSLSEIIT